MPCKLSFCHINIPCVVNNRLQSYHCLRSVVHVFFHVVIFISNYLVLFLWLFSPLSLSLSLSLLLHTFHFSLCSFFHLLFPPHLLIPSSPIAFPSPFHLLLPVFLLRIIEYRCLPILRYLSIAIVFLISYPQYFVFSYSICSSSKPK